MTTTWYDEPPAEAREIAASAYHKMLPPTYGGGLPVPCSGDHDGTGCSTADAILAAIWAWLAEGDA